MKKVFLLFTGLAGLAIGYAQQKEGTIIYERKVNLHRSIQDEQMKAMIPEFRTSQHILFFSDSISMYKAVPEDESPDPFAGGGGRVMIRMGGDAGEMYKNFAQARAIQSTEAGGRNFLILDTIRQQPWKLSEETKQILGYTCHKATRKLSQAGGVRRMMVMNGGGEPTPTDTTQSKPQFKEVEVVAWYADNITTPAGPENFGQLPGAILQLDIDKGATVYNATQIKKTVDVKELKEPKKGKIITRAEYMKIMSDMMPAGGGAVRFGAL